MKDNFFQLFHKQLRRRFRTQIQPKLSLETQNRGSLEFKEYKRMPRVKLGDSSLIFKAHALFERRTSLQENVRGESFDQNKSITQDVLSAVLKFSAGVNDKRQGFPFRFYPSGGGLYPLEVYLKINNVDALQRGLYHYGVREHVLEKLPHRETDFERAHEALQSFMNDAAVAFVITAVWERQRVKYGDLCYNLALIEAGHLAQNILLLASEFSLTSCPGMGFEESYLASALKLDSSREIPIYTIAVGKKK
jgi:SagB-type dehydrogenase family enzyme